MPKCSDCGNEVPMIIAGRCRACNALHMFKKRREKYVERKKS